MQSCNNLINELTFAFTKNYPKQRDLLEHTVVAQVELIRNFQMLYEI